jgi:ribosome-binding factor A
MTKRRQERVSERIHHELSDLLQNRISDPRLVYVTVTEVEVTADLKQATVYVSALGDGQARREALQGLEHASRYIRRELAQRLQMRFAPEVRFSLDETWERGERIDRLLDKLHSSPVDEDGDMAEDDV